ncbi:MAG TPA: hypothetical protein V6C81_06590 [Planktothrix sp.]|jgi:hypothetical protein
MAEAGAQTEQLVKARQLFQEGKLEEAHDVLRAYMLSAPSDTDALDIFANVLVDAGREDASEKISALSAAIKSTISSGALPFGDREIVRPLFEAAYVLVDLRQFELAVDWLNRCLVLAPDEPVVRYELAFALMSLQRFQEALPHFQKAAADLDDFDTYLNLSVCHMLARDLASSKTSLDKVAEYAKEDDEKKELAHRRTVFKRLEEMGNRTALNNRDWLYTLYGSILLHPTSPDLKANTREQIKTMASTLLILRGVIEGLRMEFETIEFYNPLSKPLARMVAELMELPLDSYKGPQRPDRALLVVAWAHDLIGPHRAFIDMSDRRTLFAYGMPSNEPLPIVPEIVGCLSTDQPLLWDEETRTTTVDEIVGKILDKARHLETDTDILKETQNAVEYFHLKRQFLMLGNFNGFPERPEYTAEVTGQ